MTNEQWNKIKFPCIMVVFDTINGTDPDTMPVHGWKNIEKEHTLESHYFFPKHVRKPLVLVLGKNKDYPEYYNCITQNTGVGILSIYHTNLSLITGY